MAKLTEKTLRTDRKYTGKIISVDLLDIELPDELAMGSHGQEMLITYGENDRIDEG